MYKARERVKSQWLEMLDNGKMPMIEEKTTAGFLTVEFFMSDYGIGFCWSFEDCDDFDCGTVKPYFDGCIKKRHNAYYVSFAEIDRMGYTLDAVLQIIWENVTDGVISAYNLHA